MSQVIATLLKRDAQLNAGKGNKPLNHTFDQPPKNRQYQNQNQQFPPPIQDNRNYTSNFPSNNYQTNQYNPNIPNNQNFGRKGRMRSNFNINNQFNPYPNQMNPQNRNFNQLRFPNQQNYQGYVPNNEEYNNNRNFQQISNHQNKYPTPQRFNRKPNQYQNNQNNYYANRGRGNNYQPKPQQFQQAFMKFAQGQNNSQDNFRAYNRGRSRGRRDYNERGNQFNEVRRGRNMNARFNTNEISDNRPMTSKQAEQRTKKFVNLNKSPQLRTYQGPKNISDKRINRKKSYEKPKRQQQNLPSKLQKEQESQEDISQQKMNSNQQQQEERSYDSKQKSQAQYSDSQQEYQQNQNDVQQQQYEEEQNQSKYSDKQDIGSISERSQQQKSMNLVHRQQSQCMCSTKEFNNRKKIFIENNHGKIQSDPASAFQMRVVEFNLSLDTSKSFSIFQLNKKSYLPDLSLTLKKFQRSANRAEDGVDQQQAYVPRNKQGLIAAMNHIKKYILDSDTKLAKQLPFPLPYNQKKIQFIQIYVFLWDRMREMIKDITRLSEQSKHDAQIIKICQQITRFFILSINQGRKNYQNQLTFDDKMNKQSLVKVMTPLLGLYASSKIRLIKLIKQIQQKSEQLTIKNVKKRMQKQGIYISPNEPQITSYAILFSEDYRKYLYENIFVGVELHDHNPLYQSKQIQQVLSIKSALALKNYEKYFQILQDQNYGYLLSCLMSLNIRQIRKDISQKFQYSFRYMEEGTRKKGIYSNYFRNSLHFTKDQVKQYEQFLKTVDGVKRHNKLITWDHQLPEDETIYKSPAYALDFKLKRKYFQNSSQRGQTKISRVQIVSRSWKKSTYVEQIISCFLHEQYSPINISPIRQKVNNQEEDNQDKNQAIIQSTPIKKHQKQGQKVSISEAQALINNKLQQINRKKFLQNFSLKLIELFRPDETKEQKKLKSVKDLLNILLKKQQVLLIKVFDRLDEVASEKIQKQIYLIKLQQYMKVKKDFQAQFKNQRNQIRDEQPTNQGMSSLLKLVQKTKSTKKKQIMKLQDLLIKNKIKQFNFKLFTDLNHQDPNYSLVFKIVNNIFYYALGKPKIFNRDSNKTSFTYLNQPNQNKINLSIISFAKNQNNWKQLFAADCVIYLQTSKSDQRFAQIIDEFKGIKNCIKEYPDYTLPIAVIKLYDSSQPIQFQNSSFAPLLEIQQYLKSSALQISSFLCLSLNGFLNTSILRYRKRPSITTVSLKQIIKQICLNGQFINTQIANSTKQQLFIAFQSYVNLCVEQIFRLSKIYYTAAHLFTNWLDLQYKIDASIIQNQNALAVKQNMIRQHNELKNLEQTLKFVSPFENLQHKVILNNNDFIIHYFNFLKRFDFEKILNYATITSMVQILKFKQGKIEGDVYGFYKELLTMLGMMIQKFFIIAPVNFRFSLNPKDLLNKLEQCETKIINKIRQQQEMISYTQNFKPKASTLIIFKQENKNDDLSHVKKRPRKEFKYERAKWLEDVKKQIKLV